MNNVILFLVLAIGVIKSVGRVDLKEDNHGKFAQFSSSFVLFLQVGMYLFVFVLIIVELITQPIYCTPPYALMTKQASNPVLIIGLTLISLIAFFSIVKKLLINNTKITIYNMVFNTIGTFVIAIVAIDLLLCGYLFKNYVHIQWVIPLLRLVAVVPLTMLVTYFEYRRKAKKYHVSLTDLKNDREKTVLKDEKIMTLAFVLATVTDLLVMLLVYC